MNTPWGQSDYQKSYNGGAIVFHGTPSHGGFKVYKKYNNLIPAYMRKKSGWYEEDCEWSIVAVTFPTIFVKEYKTALDTLKNWYPDHYQKLFGVTLTPDESYVLKNRENIAKSKNQYVVVSALSVDKDTVKVCAIKGGRLENGQYASNDEKWFLIPDNEYNSSHFIVNVDKHQETSPGF